MTDVHRALREAQEKAEQRRKSLLEHVEKKEEVKKKARSKARSKYQHPGRRKERPRIMYGCLLVNIWAARKLLEPAFEACQDEELKEAALPVVRFFQSVTIRDPTKEEKNPAARRARRKAQKDSQRAHERT